jgi:hypothetical protein|nr:MAG TPA: hypothetical protein [Caudoviricetes sp.]
MKTVENIKVYYGLKWVEFKPITIEKRNRLYNNGTLYKIDNAITYYPCDSEGKEFYILLDKNNRVLRRYYIKFDLYKVKLQNNQGQFLIYENEHIYSYTHQRYLLPINLYKGVQIMIDGERLAVASSYIV